MNVPPILADDLARATAASRALVAASCPPDDPDVGRAVSHYIAQDKRSAGLPLLCLGAGHACGAAREALIPVAAAVDLMYFGFAHHDDVVDDAPSRHGTPSVNRAWSNGVGVWSGDVLLVRALAQLHEHLPEALPKTLSCMEAMLVADLRQVIHAGDMDTGEETYLGAMRRKSGLPTGLCCWLGATAADAPPTRVQALEAYGIEFGTAFQIADDARDYGARRKGGDHKEGGQDFAAGLVTLPVILAWQRGTADERAFWRRALKTGPQEGGDFERAMEFMHRHDAIRDALACARMYGERAKRSLAAFPNEAGEALAWMVERYIADVEA